MTTPDPGGAFLRRLKDMPSDGESLIGKQRLVALAQIATAVQQAPAVSASPAPPKRRVRGRRDLMLSSTVAGQSEFSTHWALKRCEDMTQRDWTHVRDAFDLEVSRHRSGSDTAVVDEEARAKQRVPLPAPIRCWEEALLPQPVEEVLSARFAFPSPIQMQTIPAALAGHDVIGIAETGSGKTLSYSVPIVSHVVARVAAPSFDKTLKSPLALAIVPTRELALQIHGQIAMLTAGFAASEAVTSECVVGGEDMDAQYHALTRNPRVVVGTPGQLRKLLDNAYLSLNATSLVVVDEADVMVDEGIAEQLCTVLSYCPVARQTVMFSATFIPQLEDIAKRFLRDGVRVLVRYKFPNVRQRVELFAVQPADAEAPLHPQKVERLLHVLRKGEFVPPIIVFVNTRAMCETLADRLSAEGHRVVALHGDYAMAQRKQRMEQFRARQHDVLVATDMVARGLDVADVSLVVNFEMPRDTSGERSVVRYIHRIGRTGRGGQKGTAVSYLCLDRDALRADGEEDDDAPKRKRAATEASPTTSSSPDVGDLTMAPPLVRFLKQCSARDEDVPALLRLAADSNQFGRSIIS
jgi:superfamily II DNA/RNA helicase